VLPVRIARSTLGFDVPCADLFVTKEHALLADGGAVDGWKHDQRHDDTIRATLMKRRRKT